MDFVELLREAKANYPTEEKRKRQEEKDTRAEATFAPVRAALHQLAKAGVLLRSSTGDLKAFETYGNGRKPGRAIIELPKGFLFLDVEPDEDEPFTLTWLGGGSTRACSHL